MAPQLTSRLYGDSRRIDVTLPIVLVAELDKNIAEFPYQVSRSAVVAVALREFLDRGGVRAGNPPEKYD